MKFICVFGYYQHDANCKAAVLLCGHWCTYGSAAAIDYFISWLVVK